jgi:hypothetical protein
LSLADAVAARVNSTAPRVLTSADRAIARFDGQVVQAFSTAWRRSGNGTASLEAVVLILRMADGSYVAREMGSTNEYKRFTFRWQPGAIAIIHTHPNRSDPKPCDDDIAIARKYNVPMFVHDYQQRHVRV